MSKCDTCKERCPKAELAHQAALGRMYATNELIALVKKNEKRPTTNADRLRSMTDEELAEFISYCGCPNHAMDCRASCKDCTMKWLQQPAEGDA